MSFRGLEGNKWDFFQPFCDGSICSSQKCFLSLTQGWRLENTKYQRETRQPHLEPHSDNFFHTYLTRIIQYTLCCKRRKLSDFCFCETVCYLLTNQSKCSWTNLSLVLKMDYFFHVVFCVHNKEIIPLTKNQLELTLKQFMHYNRIYLIVTGLSQLNYTITLQSLSKSILWINSKLIIITMPETDVFT